MAGIRVVLWSAMLAGITIGAGAQDLERAERLFEQHCACLLYTSRCV